MKARLPQGFSNGGGTNLQQLARQAQKLQEEMDAANSELEQKEYSATVGGNAVTAVVTGKMEVKSLDIKPEVRVSSRFTGSYTTQLSSISIIFFCM